MLATLKMVRKRYERKWKKERMVDHVAWTEVAKRYPSGDPFWPTASMPGKV